MLTENTENNNLTAVEIPKRKGHRFEKGHPCYHRKRKDTTLHSAMSACISQAFNPIEAMIRIFNTGVLIDASGVKTPVPIHLRLKLLRELATYTHPKAPSVNVGVQQHYTEESKNFIHRVMQNPALSAAADNLNEILSSLDSKDRIELDEGPFLVESRK